MMPYGRATPHQIIYAHISTVTGLTFVTSITHYKSLPSTKLLNKIGRLSFGFYYSILITILMFLQEIQAFPVRGWQLSPKKYVHAYSEDTTLSVQGHPFSSSLNIKIPDSNRFRVSGNSCLLRTRQQTVLQLPLVNNN